MDEHPLVTCRASEGFIGADDVFGEDATRLAQDVEDAVEVHAVLALLEFVLNNRQSARSQQIFIHQLASSQEVICRPFSIC